MFEQELKPIVDYFQEETQKFEEFVNEVKAE